MAARRSRRPATNNHAEPTRATAATARVPISMQAQVARIPAGGRGAGAAGCGSGAALSPALLSAGSARDGRAGARYRAPVARPVCPLVDQAWWVAARDAASACFLAGAGVALTAGTGVDAGCGAGDEDVARRPPPPAPGRTVDGMLPITGGRRRRTSPATLTVPATRLGCFPVATMASTVISQSPGGSVAVPLQMPSMAVPGDETHGGYLAAGVDGHRARRVAVRRAVAHRHHEEASSVSPDASASRWPARAGWARRRTRKTAPRRAPP